LFPYLITFKGFRIVFLIFCNSKLTANTRNPVEPVAKHIVCGTIRDKSNGEALIGATIYIRELKTGVISNTYGFYSLTLPVGKYNLIYSFIGYKSDTLSVNLKSNIKSDRTLSESSFQLVEVVISSQKKDDNIKKTDIGVE